MEVTSPAGEVLLEARNLHRFYHTGDEETFALQGVSLAVRAGEILAITGPSGSGKSTLLACLAGLDDPDGGTVVVAGQRLSRRSEPERAALRARHVGVLFQSANLVQHLSVRQNVILAQRLGGRVDGARADRLVAEVGLAERAGALPAQLSGGQLARAGLAVALANQPAVLLADEATGELDSTTEAQILDLICQQADRGSAVVLVTHSVAVAAAAHRIVRLDDGRLLA